MDGHDPLLRLEALERELALVLEALSDPRATPERLRSAWRACARGPALEAELAPLVAQAASATAGGADEAVRARVRAALERLRRLNALALETARRQHAELERTLEQARTASIELRAMLPGSPAAGVCDVRG